MLQILIIEDLHEKNKSMSTESPAGKCRWHVSITPSTESCFELFIECQAPTNIQEVVLLDGFSASVALPNQGRVFHMLVGKFQQSG